ncbi:hypothetical protein [Psychroserpens mesophilus]|uniref:hypothetical protein n=1 Tax=Psychroserpens mesophilus TaxID=325473 RepID=UPI003D654043
MKHTKILLVLISICIFAACTSESETNVNQDTKNELKKIEEVQPTIDFKFLTKNTEKELNELLNSEGYNGLYDSKLIIGTFENDELIITSKKIQDILSLYFKLIAQEANYNADHSSFEFISAKENNGYPMLISRGVCKIKGESVSVGIGIKESQDREAHFDNGLSTITCTGCDVVCSPRRTESGDGWCTNCKSYGNCTKTETIGG